jgi:hypothetical protein
MTAFSEELREIFEAEYAAANGMKALQVKFLRACTGGYRDPEITRAARAFRETLTYLRAA